MWRIPFLRRTKSIQGRNYKFRFQRFTLFVRYLTVRWPTGTGSHCRAYSCVKSRTLCQKCGSVCGRKHRQEQLRLGPMHLLSNAEFGLLAAAAGGSLHRDDPPRPQMGECRRRLLFARPGRGPLPSTHAVGGNKDRVSRPALICGADAQRARHAVAFSMPEKRSGRNMTQRNVRSMQRREEKLK